MISAARSRGLGSTWKLDQSGNWIDCDSVWTMVTNPVNCFNPLNAQLAGPGAPNPMAPVNPLTTAILGGTTGTGAPVSTADYVTAYLGDPSNLLWIAIGIGAIVFLVK